MQSIKINICLLVFVLALPFLSKADNKQVIKGTIVEKDSKGKTLPIPGVNIVWKNTTSGTTSDADGHFTLESNVSKNNVIVVSYVGYHSQEIQVRGENNLTIELVPGEELESVDVVQRTKATSFSRMNPVSVQKLSGKELARCACCNLSESFETNASVDVSFSDAVSGVKTIKMLGLSGRYSQMMFENVPFLRGSQSAFGLEYVPGTWMESIQVSKGSAAVKNGYESVTGQINLEYKQPDALEQFNAYIYGNMDGKLETNFNYAADLNEKWSTALFLHGESHVRDMDMNDDGFLDKPRTNQVNVMNRWTYKNDHVTWKFGAGYMEESRKGGQVDYDHDLSRQEQYDVYGIQIDSRRINAFSKSGYIFDKPQTSLGFIASVDYFNRESFYGQRDYDSEQLNGYANLIFQSIIGDPKHSYNLGASFVYDDNDDYLNDEFIGYKEQVGGVFGEYTFMPSDKVTLLAGLRYDYSSLYDGFFTPRVHARYAFLPTSTLRLSAGKGYRTANAVAENTNYLASSRTFVFDSEKFEQEEAWNYGASITNEFLVNGKDLAVVVDFYRTNFENQLIVDPNQTFNEVHFYNLNGDSYSNSFQIESNYELFNRFTLSAAYRMNDVKTTFEQDLVSAPMVAKHKGLLSGSYSTRMNKWQFDLTAQFNGVKPLADASNRPEEFQRAEESDSYTVLMGQITRNHRNWSFYVGGENLTDFTQKDPIIDVENPYSQNFDSSQVWGPIYGRMFYLGVKYSFEKK